MKVKIKILLPLFCLALLLSACDRPVCKNINPVFDKYSPDSDEYKSELIKQLEVVDKTKLTYWFSQYVESAGKELLFFHIQGDGINWKSCDKRRGYLSEGQSLSILNLKLYRTL